jgi:small-conductance mechanosensitive channel
MNAHDFLANLADGFFRLWSHLFSQNLQPGLAVPLFGQVTPDDLATAGSILLLTLLLQILAALGIHRGASVAKTAQKETRHHVFRASTKPSYLLLWTFGIYFAVVPLLVKLPPDATVARGVLDKLLDLGVSVTVLWFLMRLTWILEARLAAWAQKTKTRLDDLLVPLVGRVLRIIIPVAGIILVLPILNLPASYADVVAKGSSILIILAVATVSFEAVNVGERVLLVEGDLALADNLQARKIYTQVKLLGKAAHVAIGLCTTATILMLFQPVRHLGTSLLASAGIVGIIAGIAAQPDPGQPVRRLPNRPGPTHPPGRRRDRGGRMGQD